MAQKGVEKRLLKIKDILENEKDIFNYYGNKKASILIVSWGSTKGALLEAIRDSDKYAYLQIKMLWPLNKEIGKIINAFKTKILVENNATGQLGRLLRSELAINFDKTILKYDGRPFFAEEIRKELSIFRQRRIPIDIGTIINDQFKVKNSADLVSGVSGFCDLYRPPASDN